MEEQEWKEAIKEMREVAARVEGCKFSHEVFDDGNERIIVEVERERRRK